MSSKPILFNTEMVKAILDGRKTQTRRLIKNNKKGGLLENRGYFYRDKFSYNATNNFDDFGKNKIVKLCSKYQTGDILYVKEKSYFVDCDCQCPWQCSPQGWYATDEVSYSGIRCSVETIPSIHMRKEHARIFLKVTNVRVERLQDIKYSDIEKEGINYKDSLIREGVSINTQLRRNWIILWDSTAKDGYKYLDNPYVFVYEFERIKK